MERALGFGIGGYVAGFWFFPDGFWHLMWFLAAVALPAFEGYRGGVFEPVRSDRVFGLFVLAAAVGVLWSMLVGVVDAGPWRVLGGVGNAVGLVLLVAVVIRCAAGWAAVWAEAYVAVGAPVVGLSFVLFYALGDGVFPADRFRDVVVFVGDGGLHPVLTGLLCAWGAVVAAWLVAHEERVLVPGLGRSRGRGRRWAGGGWHLACALLVAGCLYSHSRGAMLALAAGGGALALTVPWKRLGWPGLITVLVGVLYFSGFPGVPDASGGRGDRSPPGPELVARGDNGRVDLYRELSSRVDGVHQHLGGRGLWADRSAGPPEIYWSAPHPHSAYFGTYLATGVVGLGVLAWVLGAGLVRGWRLARRGAAGPWFAAFVCGAVGLVFDGDSLFALWTLPRVEPLLFWFGWAVIAGLGRGDLLIDGSGENRDVSTAGYRAGRGPVVWPTPSER